MCSKSKKINYFVAILALMQFVQPQVTKIVAQSKIESTNFTVLTGQGTLSQKISEAAGFFSNKHSGKRFWVGYEFKLRAGLVYDYLIVDEDGSTYSSKNGRRFNWTNDLSRRGRVFRITGGRDHSLFLLLDAETLTVKAIKFAYNLRAVSLSDYPGFWLGKIEPEQSFRYLSGLAQDDNERERVREAAIAILSLHAHPHIVAFLTQFVSSKRSTDVRETAAFWLGQIPGKESFEALAKLYRVESDTDMKEHLIFSISQSEGQRNIDLLSKIAKSDGNRDVREKAIFWLGQMAGRKTLDILGDIIENEEETEIKTKAVFALSQHEDERKAADMLMEIARNHQNPEVRRKAMFWLGQTGDERAIDFFKKVLAD